MKWLEQEYALRFEVMNEQYCYVVNSSTLKMNLSKKKTKNELSYFQLEDKPVEEIARTLSLLRNDRDRLSSRARRLAARNPRLAHTKPMDDIQNKWKELEGKLHEVRSIENSTTTTF